MLQTLIIRLHLTDHFTLRVTNCIVIFLNSLSARLTKKDVRENVNLRPQQEPQRQSLSWNLCVCVSEPKKHYEGH